MPKSKDADPLERWRHFEERYAEVVSPYLTGEDVTHVGKEVMVELASLRAKADRWRDRFFKGLEGVSD